MDKTTDDELIPKSTDEAVKVADEEDEVIESVLTKARQTLKDTVEIRDMGTVICEELHQQNKRLEKVGMEYATVNDELRKSERYLRSIRSFWGAVGNLFRRRKYKKTRKYHEAAGKSAEEEMQEDESVIKYHEYEAEVVEKRQRRQENQYHGATGEHPKVDHCHKQLDEILDETLTAVEDIKLQALQMRVSLKKDENMLDRLQPLAESTNERLKRNLEKAKVLCK